jgi:hypothetical protein
MFAIGVLGNVFDQVVPVEHELPSGGLVDPDVATASHAQQGGLADVEYALGLSEAEQWRGACWY